MRKVPLNHIIGAGQEAGWPSETKRFVVLRLVPNTSPVAAAAQTTDLAPLNTCPVLYRSAVAG